MSDHALLSPSSAHRWLHCTLAPRLEATLPEKTSEFAREGTIAHSVCEISAKKRFKMAKAAEYNRVIKKLKADPSWNDEMLHTAELYVDHLAERAMEFASEPYVAFEVRVDISEYVPDAFGRCDNVMLGGDTLIITDYKHGKGVKVEADRNPQMMLYALGAVKLYRPLFGGALKNVKFYIDQPRLNAYEGWGCSIDELLEWGESVKPIAQKAFMGFGEYAAGEWCRFCRANGLCKAQAEQQVSALDDFAGVIGNPSALLTPEQMGDVLTRGKTLVDWYEAVKENALAAILNGTKIPGYKAVEGRSSRIWTSQDAALEKLQASGIDRAVIYDSVPKTLAQLEKMLGKAKFNELVGEFVTKPQGKPALATADDTRAEFSRAASDFAGVVSNGAK